MTRKHDIPKLERHIKALHESVLELAVDDDFIELLKVIRFPGWTTPAEFTLVAALVDTMHTQVRELTDLRQTLLTASREIVGATELAGARG